jgi:hypothetical protein
MAVKAQYMSFAKGLPVQESDYANVTGSPYFIDKWSTGTVTFAENKIVENIPIKYNAKDEEVYFKGEDGATMRFKEPVKAFTLKEDNNKLHYFQKGFPNQSGITNNMYLEVLAAGKTQFLEKRGKTIVESKAYASGTTDKQFLDVTKFYVFAPDKFEQVKKDQKSIIEVLKDKQTELTKYIADNKLNLKNETDIVKLFNYYNSL